MQVVRVFIFFLENASPVWNYFTKIEVIYEPSKAICKFEKDDFGEFCNYDIDVTKTSDNMSCMRSHLKGRHKVASSDVEVEIKRKRKKQKGVGTSDEAQEAQKCNILTIVYY